MKKMKTSTLRGLVVLAVTLVIAVGYFTHMGIGNLSGFGFDVFSVLCPLGYLESLLASRTFVPRALISFVGVCVLVLLLGRVFCAWICPMPQLQRFIPGFKAKQKAQAAAEAHAARADLASDPSAKPNRFKLDSRFGVLVGALASAAIFGFPVFCLVCPVGLTFATVYLVMRLFAFGEVTWTVIAVPLVLLVEVVFFRTWCSKFCPLGALMSLLSAGNRTLRPTIDDKACLHASKGVKCFACSKACPQHIDIRRPDISEAALSDCTKCRECADHCPAHAITFPILPQSQGTVEAKAEVKH
ncbi:Putative electron transport protein yccM [Slackia heliotrinireducens]|uniref:Polyferredoxin n=1 Tax=Slackia heliotrinireducens (strain ATCC 29202 / DSM 20476 / NCTC 11029 / RHS 1) TaxID=471855 RepID=C7N3T6_SLAHD|nr:4Fe-4S binding protein [Slackia heliotrinireducens]ACV21677.1 polyferredoxin [Slackia heliotrinireducens DSM 20476]VEG99295.1 Putative electron transport protein yccM [Slackia heliotrinireducens]